MEGWRLACVDIFRFIDSVTHMYLFSIGLLLKLIFGKPGEPTECCRTCSRQAKYLKHIFGHFLPDTWSFWTKIGQIYRSCLLPLRIRFIFENILIRYISEIKIHWQSPVWQRLWIMLFDSPGRAKIGRRWMSTFVVMNR